MLAGIAPPSRAPGEDTADHSENPVTEVDTCSAKDCRAPAVWDLQWNNPKLHTPDRRKTWLACEDHRESLSGFLGARNFLRDVVAHQP